MSSMAFQGINPRIVDPYPIETNLADMIANPSTTGVGLPLLNLYRADRDVQSRNYMDQLNLQHQLAMQQMGAYMATEGARSLPELQKAGLLGAASRNPLFAPFYQGMDPNDISAIGNLGIQMQRGEIAKNIQQASQAGAEAGTPFSPATVSSVSGLPTTAGDPLALAKERIAAAGRVAAAGVGLDRATITSPDDYGTTVSAKVPFSQIPSALNTINTITGRSTGATSNRAPIGVGSTIPPPAGSTSAPPVSPAAASGSARGQTSIPPDVIGKGQQAFANLRAGANAGDANAKAAYNDIASVAKSGQALVQQNSDGSYSVVGKTRTYKLQ